MAASTGPGQRTTVTPIRRQPRDPASFSVQDGLSAQGDPVLLRAVLENLLGNAWKFTGKTASPRVEVAREDREGDAVFVVRDNGAGFDPAYASRLFGVFQRLHTAAEFEGTGIGLATVHRIVRRHGGRVWAEGAPGRGASFHFTLPAPGHPFP